MQFLFKSKFLCIKESLSLMAVLFLTFSFSSCQNFRNEKIKTILPVDSFFVQYQDPFERANARISEDGSYIRVYFPSDKIIANYKREDRGKYEPSIYRNQILSTNQNLSLFFESKDSIYLLGNKELLILDKVLFKGRSLKVSGELKHLQNNFNFSSYPYNNAFLRGDTLYASIFYRSLNPTTDFFNNYKKYLKEPSIFSFKMKNDSLIIFSGKIYRPKEILLHTQNFNAYSTTSSNQLFVVFGAVDSLYFYDFISKKENKSPLFNPFYQPNNPYDWNNQDFCYDAKYNIENFTYKCIYFDSNTKNLILFFEAPYLEEEKIPYGNHLYAMVLDEKLKRKAIYNLGRNYDINCIMEVPEKGLGIPLVKPKMKRLFIIFIVFSMASCNPKKVDFNYLNSFTKDAYNIDLDNKELRLFFIASQCIPCINKDKIKPFIENKRYLIITEDPAVKELCPNWNVLLSKDSKMHLLKENEYSNTIWDVKNNEVIYFQNHISITDAIK